MGFGGVGGVDSGGGGAGDGWGDVVVGGQWDVEGGVRVDLGWVGEAAALGRGFFLGRGLGNRGWESKEMTQSHCNQVSSALKKLFKGLRCRVRSLPHIIEQT